MGVGAGGVTVGSIGTGVGVAVGSPGTGVAVGPTGTVVTVGEIEVGVVVGSPGTGVAVGSPGAFVASGVCSTLHAIKKSDAINRTAAVVLLSIQFLVLRMLHPLLRLALSV